MVVPETERRGNIIVYDIEVYKYDFFFGAKYFNGSKKGQRVRIYNDMEALYEFIYSHLDHVFVGFNNVYYDDKVVTGALRGIDPYEISVDLIEHKKNIWYKVPFISFDVLQDLFGQKPKLDLIKYNEGFEIYQNPMQVYDQKLTDEEIIKTWEYNDTDVDVTEVVLTKGFGPLFGVKLDVIEYFKIPIENLSKSLPTVMAIGLGAKKGKFTPREPEWFDNLRIDNVPGLKEWVMSKGYLKGSYDFEVGGIPHKFGSGGLHGAPDYPVYVPRCLLVDVKGYYSLIMMKYDAFSRALAGQGTEGYTGMYYERLRRQEAKDPTANSLKLGILAVWGATRNQYHLLFDETTGHRIAVTGQLFLIDLAEKMSPYGNLVQSNTDGIMIEPEDEPAIMAVIDEWVERTGFEVTIDEVTQLYQKDVSNYICYENGWLKTKGSYATSYGVENVFAYGSFFKYHGGVMDKALVNYLMHGTPIEDTVNNETDPKQFMMAGASGPTFKGCELHTTYHDGTTKVERIQDVNRVFACKDDSVRSAEVLQFKFVDVLEPLFCPLGPDMGPIMHVPPRARKPRPKEDGIWKSEKRTARVRALPEKVFIDNRDLSEFDRMDDIDRQWYIDEAIRKTLAFLGDEGK